MPSSIYKHRPAPVAGMDNAHAVEVAPLLMKAYNQSAKISTPRLLTDSEFDAFTAYLNADPREENPLIKAEQIYHSAEYAKFEKLKMAEVSYESTKLFYGLRELFGDDGITMDNPEFRKYAEDNLQNPFFRLSIEMAGHTPNLQPESLRDNCSSIARQMNELMMSRTLQVPTQEQRENLAAALGSTKQAEQEIQKNKLTQITLAKTMFLAHLGTFHVVDKNGHNEPYTGSYAETLAHGGRTTFFFGANKPGTDTIAHNLFHDLRGDRDNGTTVSGRLAATHKAASGKAAEGAGAYQEKSSKLDIHDNYGMNTAVGGLGNKFGEKTMLNDGRSGHLFIKSIESTGKKGGCLMVGMEGSETFKKGKTGRLHLGGGSSNTSAFVSGKGAPGAKLGGRLVDLSIWDHEALGAILKKFNDAYGQLQDDAYANKPGAKEKLDAVNAKLSGKMMNGQEIDKDGVVQYKLAKFLQDDLGIREINIKGHDVTLRSLLEYRDHFGARNFQAMNQTAAKRDNALLESGVSNELDYTPSPDFETLSGELDQAKRFVLGKEKNSPEMQLVKQAMDQTMLLVNDPEVNGYAMRLQLKQLKKMTEVYLGSRKKDNDRRKVVSKIDALAQRELQRIDRIIGPADAPNAVPPAPHEQHIAKTHTAPSLGSLK
ncbi:MAG: hypothetical protein KBS74_04690 [Clostridiales bacterium]|nr:hypothetical protein [Candidatus Cacconaster stercorequi]